MPHIGADVVALLDEPAPVQWQRAPVIDSDVDADRLASMLGLGIGLPAQRASDASITAGTLGEGSRVLLGGTVRASSVA